ncbi:hypothetical protein ACFQE0_09860 [Methylobacterium komagatae]|uniref:Uncharacterized protein n=1 Tax=Methylobacterium komagatae TaxID=374425 RepID=A0ABW2BIF9_9HYPH
MRDTDKSDDPAELAASLRSLFDSVVTLPVDDPLKVKTRDFLAGSSACSKRATRPRAKTRGRRAHAAPA